MLENLQWRWCCINKEPKLRGPADIFQLFDVQIFVCSEEGGARADVVGGAMGYIFHSGYGLWESGNRPPVKPLCAHQDSWGMQKKPKMQKSLAPKQKILVDI